MNSSKRKNLISLLGVRFFTSFLNKKSDTEIYMESATQKYEGTYYIAFRNCIPNDLNLSSN